MTKYEQASSGSKHLVDTLHQELSNLLPTTNRQNADSLTSFGAVGYSKYAFVYLSKKSTTVTVYFISDANTTPTHQQGMPIIKRRNNMNSDWARITPFYASLNDDNEVAPFARFLIDYSLPRATSKRGKQARNIEREIKLPEEVPTEFFSEGHASQTTVNRYERDPKARKACLKHHGTSCAACGIIMEAFYGSIAHGFIHVHHLVPLSARKGKYTIKPKLDLIPLCPNCHAITHLANPALSLEQLKIKIAKR